MRASKVHKNSTVAISTLMINNKNKLIPMPARNHRSLLRQFFLIRQEIFTLRAFHQSQGGHRSLWPKRRPDTAGRRGGLRRCTSHRARTRRWSHDRLLFFLLCYRLLGECRRRLPRPLAGERSSRRMACCRRVGCNLATSDDVGVGAAKVFFVPNNFLGADGCAGDDSGGVGRQGGGWILAIHSGRNRGYRR